MATYIITKGEMEAGALMSRAKGEMSTKDSFREDANYIIDLAHRIERERLEVAMSRASGEGG